MPLFPYGYGLTYSDDTWLSNLPEDDAAADMRRANPRLIRIFDGRAIDPFELLIGDHLDADSPVAGSTTRSPAAALSASPTDRLVQGDGIRARWTGTGEARIYFQNAGRQVIEILNGTEPKVSFVVRVDESPTGPVEFRMMHSDGHEFRQDLTSLLASLPKGTWEPVLIPLAAIAGSRLTSGDIPFCISSSGPLCLSLADIKIDSTDG